MKARNFLKMLKFLRSRIPKLHIQAKFVFDKQQYYLQIFFHCSWWWWPMDRAWNSSVGCGFKAPNQTNMLYLWTRYFTSLVPFDPSVIGKMVGACHNLSVDRLSAAWLVCGCTVQCTVQHRAVHTYWGEMIVMVSK